MPGRARDDQHRRRREECAAGCDQLGDRPARSLRSVDPQRDRRRHAEEREAQLEIDHRPAERCHPEQRHQRGHVERRAQRVVGGRDIEVHGDRDQAERRRDPHSDRQRSQAHAFDASNHRPGDQQPHDEQADRRHHEHEHRPARDQQLRGGGGRRDVRDPELGRRSRIRSDRVGEEPIDRVTVDRDRAPVDQVPPLGQIRPQRHHQRVGIRRRAVDGRGRLLAPVDVGHRDDREPGLDGLVVGQLDVRGRRVEHDARRRDRLDQVRVRGGAGRQREPGRDRDRRHRDTRPPAHASSRSREPPISAKPPASSPSTPTTSAMIVSSDTPPPPSELTASIVGAG